VDWSILNTSHCAGDRDALVFVVLGGDGVIDSERLILHFENAGHSSPIVLRGGEATILTEGGTVLGLFPKSAYEDRQFALRPGDCLLSRRTV
jgi:hypothetical protein